MRTVHNHFSGYKTKDIISMVEVGGSSWKKYPHIRKRKLVTFATGQFLTEIGLKNLQWENSTWLSKKWNKSLLITVRIIRIYRFIHLDQTIWHVDILWHYCRKLISSHVYYLLRISFFKSYKTTSRISSISWLNRLINSYLLIK